MQKLTMHTKSQADVNFAKLAALFPQAVTERIAGYDENGKAIIERAIDKDVLMAEIATHVVEGPNTGKNQRYQFTWPDKAKTVQEANQAITDTLRPCREESVNFDDTENLYIEGDNLKVLKILQETYLGKVKMIYIDPPYNTGNDFVYNDDFTMDRESFDEASGVYDDDGNKLFKNTESNGRFHTDWLNMMYPRLKYARNLLTDDGVIFISIDDNEVHNLRKICDEIFGAGNFVANIIWEKKYTRANDAKYFSDNHDHILCFCKNKSNLVLSRLKRTEKQNEAYKNTDNDKNGPWKLTPLQAKSGSDLNFRHTFPNGVVWSPPKGRYSAYSHERLDLMFSNCELYFGKDGKGVPQRKTYLKDVNGLIPVTIWGYQEVGENHEANGEMKLVFGQQLFDNPKPVRLITRTLALATQTTQDSIILDFFSGSATTAHAVMQLNAEDGGKRKYIMVQIPEETGEKSEARKAGYKNICEIGKERIRRAGAMMKADIEAENAKASPSLLDDAKQKAVPDVGFRVLKVDSTNMQNVYYKPQEYAQDMLSLLDKNIKQDRNAEDLLFQVMLELGIPLSAKIETLPPAAQAQENPMDGKTAFCVDEDRLIACFDQNITEKAVEYMVKRKPHYLVMRDSSLESDSLATNFTQIIASYSPDTQLKVL